MKGTGDEVSPGGAAAGSRSACAGGRRRPRRARCALQLVEYSDRVSSLEERQRALLDRLNVGVFRANLDGRVLEVNPALLRLVGLSTADEAEGKDLDGLLGGDGCRRELLERIGQDGMAHDVRLPVERTQTWVALTVTFETTDGGDLVLEGLLGPDRFLTVADDAGLKISLGRWVLHEACRSLREWPAEHSLHVSVNLTLRRLLHRELVDDVARLLDQLMLPHSSLVLELGEGLLLATPRRRPRPSRGCSRLASPSARATCSVNRWSPLPPPASPVGRA